MQREGYAIHCLAQRLGYFDGDVHKRDGIPANSAKLTWSLPITVGSRTALCLLVAYDPNQQPASKLVQPVWWLWLFVHISLYSVVLDFWYYCVHRAWHEVPSLWKYHRRHHTTKHPNIRLTTYADSEQELFDSVGAPVLAYMTIRAAGLPFGFYTWWICLQYVVHTEVIGHSGLRVYYTPPITMTWLLECFNVELVGEDHNLHHRKGWRNARNYGKQTRIWDRLFGTFGDRIETVSSNIAHEEVVVMPIF